MSKKDSRNLERAKKCVDQTVKDWNKTTLSDIEKWSLEEHIIWGIVHMALFFLDFNDYEALKEYIWTEYGYDVTSSRSTLKN